MAVDLESALHAGLCDEPSASRPAGIEIRLDLAPAGDLPVQPPAYDGRVEIHDRHIDGERRSTVELDSVGSSANRLEAVLLELHRSGKYPLPVSSTTVRPQSGEPIKITTLEMPHRVFDAWLRLSSAPEGEGGSFENSDQGRELSLAYADALDPLLETSAHDLLFGVWDSHRKGPRGQVRIGRSLTTSLIGLDPIEQAQFAARRDPLNIGEASDLPKGAKKLSEQGLSSIPPQKRIPYEPEPDQRIVGFNGGVAITEARYLGFLSFAGLRRLNFQRYDSEKVRIVLAALALRALTLRAAAGWDLRSRCSLVARGELRLRLVDSVGGGEGFVVSMDEAEQFLDRSVAATGVNDRGVHVQASPALDDLVDKSIASSDGSA